MSNSDSAEKLLKDAEALAQQKKFNAAFRKFKNAIQLHYGYASEVYPTVKTKMRSN